MQPQPRSLVLANGMRCLLQPQAGSQVCLQLAYRLGRREDSPAQPGLAGLALQAMAGPSRQLGPGAHAQWLAGAGGVGQLSLLTDYGLIASTVPARQLEPLLWAEAERCANVQLDAASLHAARQRQALALQCERARPLDRLTQAARQIDQNAQTGRSDQSDQAAAPAAGVEALRDFLDARRHPEQILLVLTGAFDPERAQRSLAHWFGSIRAPLSSLPLAGPAGPVEPAASGAAPAAPRQAQQQAQQVAQQHAQQQAAPPTRQLALAWPGLPLPGAALLWPAPAAGAPGAAVWQLAQALLGLGPSGRLHDTLVDEQAVVHALSLSLQQHREGGQLVLAALGARGQSAAPLAAALQRELQRLADEPISQAELDKARGLLLRQRQRERASPAGLAAALAQAWLQAPWNDAALAEVDAAQIQQLWRRELQGPPRLSLLAHVQGGRS